MNPVHHAVASTATASHSSGPDIWIYFLAFAVSSIINGINLATTNYPRSFFLIVGCWQFYAYCFLYGVVAVVLFALSPLLNKHHLLEIDTSIGGSRTTAIIIGLFAKSFMHMRIAAIDDTPIGTETVAKLFEDPLLGEIELYHHNKLRAFLKPYIAKYTNVEEVRKIITDDIPAKWTLDKRAEVLQNFKEAETVNVVFDRYFNLNGKASIEALFPLN